jgi:Class II flagellar assembly regulator
MKSAVSWSDGLPPARPGQILPGINYAASKRPESPVSSAERWESRDMKVSGPAGPSAAGGARPARAQGAAPGFEPLMPTTSSAGAAGVSAAGGVARVASLDALMALQEVGGPLERRRRAVGRASQILDALDDLKLDLLEGRLSPDSLAALTRSVREQRSLTDDPRLESVLDEIETRAAVELAKLEVVKVAA